jgi:Rv0078B-related antitoxin
MNPELTPEYVATLRRMTGEQKLKAAFAMYWSARRLKAAALKQQHPDWTEQQVEGRVSEIFLHGVA